MALTMGVWVLNFLKEKFAIEETGLSDINSADKIFISRDPLRNGGRRLSNHDEVVDAFVERGFKIVVPEDHSVAQQAEIFSKARVVAASHGAGLTNIAFCQPGTQIVEFFGDHLAR